MLHTRDAPVRAKLETSVLETAWLLQFESTLLARCSDLTNRFGNQLRPHIGV